MNKKTKIHLLFFISLALCIALITVYIIVGNKSNNINNQINKPQPQQSERVPSTTQQPSILNKQPSGVDLTQEKTKGIAKIDSDPKDADVYINDLAYKSPLTLSLDAGEYDFWIIKPGYEVYQSVIVIEPGQTTELNIKLNPRQDSDPPEGAP